MLGKDYAGQDCSMASALEAIGERWTLLIIRDAFYGVRRFNDFRVHLDIPKAVLSDRLSGLVDDGIFARTPDPQHAGRHLYELTATGRELWPVIHALLMWGGKHRQPNSRVYRHARCGTLLSESGECPQCEVTPPPEDVLTERRRGYRPTRDDAVTVALRAPRRLLEPLET
ncbi:MAG: winged helix-turn-helix transcriptional regulator [Solirubrobacteraceae bacterium]